MFELFSLLGSMPMNKSWIFLSIFLCISKYSIATYSLPCRVAHDTQCRTMCSLLPTSHLYMFGSELPVKTKYHGLNWSDSSLKFGEFNKTTVTCFKTQHERQDRLQGFINVRGCQKQFPPQCRLKCNVTAAKKFGTVFCCIDKTAMCIFGISTCCVVHFVNSFSAI